VTALGATREPERMFGPTGYSAGMEHRGPLNRHDLEIFRRSLACNGLPNDQVAWLLVEAGQLLEQRERVRTLVKQLVNPMVEVRAILNELYAAVGDIGDRPAADSPPERSRQVRH
jgi:hypothetical protein